MELKIVPIIFYDTLTAYYCHNEFFVISIDGGRSKLKPHISWPVSGYGNSDSRRIGVRCPKAIAFDPSMIHNISPPESI